MADIFETKPNNFGTPKSITKYLDHAGLISFWGRVKDYVDNQDLSLFNLIKDQNREIADLKERMDDSNIQPDWNNNTPGTPGYIENRTHYIDYTTINSYSEQGIPGYIEKPYTICFNGKYYTLVEGENRLSWGPPMLVHATYGGDGDGGSIRVDESSYLSDDYPLQLITSMQKLPSIYLPSSMPANGGNADTVDGKHASDFAVANHNHDYLPLSGGTMSGQINSQDIKPVEDNTYQLGDSTHKYKNVFSDFFTGNLEGNAKTASDLTGRIEATPEVFTYRPSAGEKSIKDDNAFIRRVKGNSVVWNQLVKNGDFASAENWVSNSEASTTLTIEGGKAIVTSKYAGTGGDPVAIRQILPPSVANHKYFVSLDFNTNNTDLTPYFEYYKAFSGYASSMFRDGNTYSSIFTAKESGATNFLLKPQGTKAVGDVWEWDNVMVIDLTAMFGAGNEPTTVEEFRVLYPNSYYTYNAGELRNLNCYGIKTVGFNQWDEQWEVGYLNADGTTAGYVPNYIRAKNYIPVISGEKYYAKLPNGVSDAQLFAVDENYNLIKQIFSWENNRFFIPDGAAYIRFYLKYGSEIYNNDICINLSHTGYRDGEYAPYKEVTHSLPLSQITNGEPLRKAGSVYDEINETHYIKRVGVVDLGSLNWANAANNIFACTEMPNMIVTTDVALRLDGLLCTKYAIDTIPSIDATMSDKTMKRNNGWLYIKDTSFTDVTSFKAAFSGVFLHYELAEPIVTPIETPIDFNYYVEDFGTEEALLTENSAPFSADIVYQFNAVDTIRQNSLNIKKFNDHTHTVSGTVTSSLSGASAASNGPSISYSATTGVLTITMAHTHTVSGTVTSSLSGASAASNGAHTHEVPADTTNVINVAS